MSDEVHAELAAIVGEVHEHLRNEWEMGARGVIGRQPGTDRGTGTDTRADTDTHPDTVTRTDTPTDTPTVAVASPPAVGLRRLQLLEQEAATCTKCRLHSGRTRSVFARGSITAPVVFVGEGPGYNEDKQGKPFVGKAGQLLDRMITAMGLGKDEFYICNVVKCRPPENRTPNPDEAEACRSFLEGQLEVVAPKVIVGLGRCAAQGLGLVGPDSRGWRGRWGTWREVPVMPTYHPAYLLRNPEEKRPVWEDLQAVMATLGRPLPVKKGE